MTKSFLIQPVGETSYGHLDKKVKSNPSFLTGLTNQKKISIRDEHSGKIVSEILGLYYQDGGLYGVSKDDIDLTNRGISPVYKNIKIKEYDDYLELISATIESVDIVDNPRNHETFLYNSATVIEDNTNKEENIMGESNDYIKRIGALETEVNATKDAEKAVREQLTAKESEYDSLKKEYDSLKTKHENYETKEANTVEAKAIKLANGDTDLETVYKGMSLDQLKILEDKKDSEIAEEIKTQAEELANGNEELEKVLLKLPLEDLETYKKSNEEWDQELAKLYENDTGFRGAGAGQNNGYNPNGTKTGKDGIKTREDYEKVVEGVMPKDRPNFKF